MKEVTVTFVVDEESYNSGIMAGHTDEGLIVVMGYHYYMEPLHEGLCFAINSYDVSGPSDERFSTEFHNDADTTAECLLAAIHGADRKKAFDARREERRREKAELPKEPDSKCLICGEPVPMSKNHRYPVYVEGQELCEEVCYDCIYQGQEETLDNLHPDFYYCEGCGDYSKGNKCLGECKGRTLTDEGYEEDGRTDAEADEETRRMGGDIPDEERLI